MVKKSCREERPAGCFFIGVKIDVKPCQSTVVDNQDKGYMRVVSKTAPYAARIVCGLAMTSVNLDRFAVKIQCKVSC